MPPASPDAPLPYGRQSIDQADVEAVVDALQSDWLTTGPKVAAFEEAVAAASGVSHAVALSNGTVALQAMLAAAGIGPRDEVIVPTLTFVATANTVVMQGATPVFADIDPDTLLIDPESVKALVSSRTKAVVGVDFAGQPFDVDAVRAVVPDGCRVFADGAHSIGGAQGGRPVGSLADATTYSFHPVKTITTAEGGMVVTDDAGLAQAARTFRNHGIPVDHHARGAAVSHVYDMVSLGTNGRLTDLQCALGLSQMHHLQDWVSRRQELSARYDEAFTDLRGVTPLRTRDDVSHARHLYVIRINVGGFGRTRDEVFTALREQGIGVNVHYRPVHLHSYYRENHGTKTGDCPRAEAVYEEILSLPLFPAMDDGDVDRVVDAVRALAGA